MCVFVILVKSSLVSYSSKYRCFVNRFREMNMKQTRFWKWTEAIVGRANVYNWVQRTVGSSTIWSHLKDTLETEFTSFQKQDIWVDLGCGTSEFLEYIPDNIQYIGIDNNPEYIRYARSKFQYRKNCTFICGNWSTMVWQKNTRVISVLGLLHHLSDEQVKEVLALSWNHLSEGGCLISLDGCPTNESGLAERFFYWIDRGNYIRTKEHLCSLFPTNVQSTLHSNWLKVPYQYLLCKMVKK